MRIYLPLQAQDTSAVAGSRTRCELGAGRALWGIGDGARAQHPGTDLEDLEYEAVQDAAFVALEAVASSRATACRAVVLAGDLPDPAPVEEAPDGGAFGLVLTEDAVLRLASIHVTERVAKDALADDTDPALLWFDVSEGASALDYAGLSSQEPR
jgi:hypothetical protein